MKKFIIKSTDSYGDKNFEIVEGKVQKLGNDTIYTYTSKLGECEVTHSGRRVIISRKGEVSSLIDIDLDRKTDFFYVTKEIKKNFIIVAEKIEYDSEKNILEFSYKIFDSDVELNKITIAIKNY